MDGLRPDVAEHSLFTCSEPKCSLPKDDMYWNWLREELQFNPSPEERKIMQTTKSVCCRCYNGIRARATRWFAKPQYGKFNFD